MDDAARPQTATCPVSRTAGKAIELLACEDGTYETSATLGRRRLALWTITGLVVLLLTASWWATWVIYWTL